MTYETETLSPPIKGGPLLAIELGLDNMLDMLRVGVARLFGTRTQAQLDERPTGHKSGPPKAGVDPLSVR